MVGFFVPWLTAGVFIVCYSIAGILMEMWMDLGAIQQTQEKPGSTVTFPSAVIIPLKTSVSLSCNLLRQLEDIQWLIWKTDLRQCFRLEIKAAGKWCSKSVPQVLRMVLIPWKPQTQHKMYLKLMGVLPCVSKQGCSCRNFPCSCLVTWHNCVCVARLNKGCS